MPLTDHEKQFIRDEEFFRAEVRKQMSDSRPRSLLAQVGVFLDSRAGFWLLTTVLASVFATSFTALQRYWDRNEIANRERAERRLRDTDTLLKLVPMLTSTRPTDSRIAFVLLNGLAADNAVDAVVSRQITDVVNDTINAGVQPGATADERIRSEAILSGIDQARLTQIQAPAGTTVATPATAPAALIARLDQAALPVRVYIQTPTNAERTAAEQAASRLREAGVVVPGIERVGAAKSPRQNQVRYCAEKVSPDVLMRVRTVVAGWQPPPTFVPMDQRLCGNVRVNHFELWFATNQAPS